MDSDHDAYKPAQMAALVETAGVAKARMPLGRMVTLAVLAGVFIGLGSAFYLMAITGADPNMAPRAFWAGWSLLWALFWWSWAGQSCLRATR